ncbi:hypothetical protein BGZ80_004225 [Entomortierella chlamydospora]|uniref:Kelch repeat-containing protein n=1 Tax=Entomortierella chlamydospora TaxID=101097 RepID=A0A9P6N1P9_9FUNG|nr:hypothetical protein BGZ80_004225 [Entomortierella chlamydospora]
MRPSSLPLFVLSLVACTISAQAQSYQPQLVYLPASVFVEGKALYVMGGYLFPNDTTVSQMFYLDLSTSWSTSSPVYKGLSDGVNTAQVPSALVDSNTWYINAGGYAYLYDFAVGSWTNVGGDNSLYKWGTGAAANPDTGRIYVPNGYYYLSVVDLLVYYTADKTFHYNTMHPGLASVLNYCAVWAPTIKSMLVFGGNIAGTWTNNNDLYAYDPVLGWSLPTVKGNIPQPRSMACLVPAYSGTKMVLYGGFASSATNTSGDSFNDIYILDVATYTWSQGNSATGMGRGGHACAVSGDYFIIWGGYSNLTPQNMTEIYNLKTSSWTTNYVYSPPVSQPSSSATSTRSQSGTPTVTPNQVQSGSKSNVAVIAGCVAGAVVLILLAGGLIWRKRKPKPSTAAEPKPTEPATPAPVQGQYAQPHLQPLLAPLPPNLNQHPQPQMQYAPYQPQPFVPPQQAQVSPLSSTQQTQQTQPVYQQPPAPIAQQTQQTQPVYQQLPAPVAQQTQPIYQRSSVPIAQQAQHVYQPPVLASDPSGAYYQPVSQPAQHVYQPPVMTSEQVAGYYQPNSQQSQQIYQSSPMPSVQSTGYYQTSDGHSQSPMLSDSVSQYQPTTHETLSPQIQSPPVPTSYTSPPSEFQSNNRVSHSPQVPITAPGPQAIYEGNTYQG